MGSTEGKKTDNREEPVQILSRIFGYASFREGQQEIIEQILAGRDVLAVMPTGAGKSICYQTPALIMEGITLVISPLISLMKDQVAALQASGVDAIMLSSALDAYAFQEALEKISRGSCPLVYVAPERLGNESFVKAVCGLPVSMITVDEAHCVSQWGQNFRPGYLDIADFAARFTPRPVVSAFTATATMRVREDIRARLALQDPWEIVTGFNRPNLHFSVQAPAGKMRELVGWLSAHQGMAGIVYCSTRKTVDEVSARLQALGFPAVGYHAGMGDRARKVNQEDFQYDRKTIMVATNAFGMGIDKSNVSFVIHYNMPKDLESYYQEAGRAGRDGSPAECILYYSGRDVITNQFLIRKSVMENEELSPDQREEILKNDEERLRRMTFYSTTNDCLRASLLKYFGESNTAPFCGHCSNCETSFEEADMTEEVRAVLSCVHLLSRRSLAFGKSFIAGILHGANNERIRNYRLDKTKVWGLLKSQPTHRIGKVIDYLVTEGFLQVSEGKYPVVALARDASERFQERDRFLIKLPKNKPERLYETAGDREILERGETGGRGGGKKTAVGRRGAGNGRVSGAPAEGHPDDESLFQQLRALRKTLADQSGIPAFVVFTAAALRDMCRKKPRSERDFLSVSGVGEVKRQRYGAAFLEEIRRFTEADPQNL